MATQVQQTWATAMDIQVPNRYFFLFLMMKVVTQVLVATGLGKNCINEISFFTH